MSRVRKEVLGFSPVKILIYFENWEIDLVQLPFYDVHYKLES